MKNFKNTLVLLSFLFSAVTLNANTITNSSPQKPRPLLEHLITVNEIWKNYSDYVPATVVSFETDADRISCHLKLVATYLKTQKSDKLTAQQFNNRRNLITTLEGYAKAGRFPMNSKYENRQPCFVDANNTHCAVGYLMAASENDKLVGNIVASYNYSYLEDIKTNGVTEWAAEYGFTLNELAWIQPSYPPIQSYESVENGTNGTVNFMARNYAASGFVFAGDFTEVNNLPCLNVGVYKLENLTCLGSGVEGIVTGIFERSDAHYAYGELMFEGATYPLAKFSDGVWEFIEIPTRIGATASAGYKGTSAAEVEIAISHSEVEGQEIWWLNDEGVWTKKATLNGTVYAIKPTSLGTVFAGHFSNVISILDGETEAYTANNIIIKPTWTDEWQPINQPVSDTIKTIEAIGSTVYFGGSASIDSESEICLSSYYLGELAPLRLLSNFSGLAYVSINSVAFDGATNLILGGDFHIDVFGGTYGDYLAEFNLVYNQIQPIAIFDKPVHAILRDNSNAIYIGGQFVTNGALGDLNHLVKLIPSSIGLDDVTASKYELTAFPNPFTSQVTLSNLTEAGSYKLFNQQGQLILQGELLNQTITGLENLPKGNYILQIQTATAVSQIKLTK